ncbi:MAG: hypothetical protein J6V25_12640, partial [Oscillospiraceae bacterium]|nr:hypothetical protein [Oscillospiraceae bacterium]
PGMLEQHLEECVGFCKMAGAERIYGLGAGLDQYPEFMSVLEMRGAVQLDPDSMACLFPVTEQTVSRWREIHNKAMVSVDNAGTLEKRDEKRILESAGAYFVHDNGNLLGIGWVENNTLLAVASVVPGSGRRIVQTLMTLVPGEDMCLQVASTNEKALRLYERMGFVKTRCVECWHVLHKSGTV